jgi:hypothetical protein
MSGEFDDDFFTIHSVTVETFEASGAFGDVFADPVTVSGFMDGSRRLVRNATGEEVVSESTFFANVTYGPLFTPDSKVTFGSTVSRVINANTNDSGILDLPDHIAVNLV